MAWFKRSKENIASDTQKKELPDGLWEKCPSCNEIIHKKQLEQNLWTCPKRRVYKNSSGQKFFQRNG